MTSTVERVAERLLRLSCNQIWNIGFIEQRAEDIVHRGVRGRVRWLPSMRKATFLADPSWRERPDGGATWFAEYMDLRRPRGEIWSAQIEPGSDPGSAEFHPAHRDDFHMSYPTPFTDDAGVACITAEIWPSDNSYYWVERNAEWHRAGVFFRGRPAVDPTLWHEDNRWWLFCTFRAEGPDDRLFLFYAKHLNGDWTPHKLNPVKINSSSARPAGPIFRAGSMLVRPAQDCSRTYGGAVVLNEITRLDEDGFEERPIRRIEPFPGRYPAGLHTFCPAGDLTLIDGKTWQFDIIRVPRKFKKVFGIKAD